MATKMTDEKLVVLAEALEAYFAGEIIISDVEEYTDKVIKRPEFVDELDRLTCHHPHCTEHNPCRSSKRRSGGKMCCTCLTDTQFDGYACPFFKTEGEYQREFWRTYTAEKPIMAKSSRRQYLRFDFSKRGTDNDTPISD